MCDGVRCVGPRWAVRQPRCGRSMVGEGKRLRLCVELATTARSMRSLRFQAHPPTLACPWVEDGKGRCLSSLGLVKGPLDHGSLLRVGCVAAMHPPTAMSMGYALARRLVYAAAPDVAILPVEPHAVPVCVVTAPASGRTERAALVTTHRASKQDQGRRRSHRLLAQNARARPPTSRDPPIPRRRSTNHLRSLPIPPLSHP